MIHNQIRQGPVPDHLCLRAGGNKSGGAVFLRKEVIVHQHGRSFRQILLIAGRHDEYCSLFVRIFIDEGAF